MTITVDLIRHGEPVGGQRYRGHLDDPLSQKGWQQMQQAVANYSAWNNITTSPLSRCAEFAQQLGDKSNTSVVVEPRFMEIGFGDWEGHTAKEIMKNDESALLNFWQDPINNTPPNAEPLPKFQDRVLSGWNETLDKQPDNSNLLIVGHAGVIRIILAEALNMPLDSVFRIKVANAGISQIQIDYDNQGNKCFQFISHTTTAQ